jgi:hypothetical protein
MKKTKKTARENEGDLRPEYDLDYSKARPNPYAARLKGRAVAVVLESDVAAAFPSSQSVNTALRSVVAAVPRRSRTRLPASGRRRPVGRHTQS